MVTKETAKRYWFGIGRRKTAVASVRLLESEKAITLNGNKTELPESVMSLFELIGKKGDFGISIKSLGGGKASQIEAIRLGVARALEKFNPDFRLTLRKKPGLRGARRSPQWAKR